MRTPVAAVVIGLVLAGFGREALAESHPDHPLISRYPASNATAKQTQDFASYKLIVGLDAKFEFESRTVSGRVTRIRYENPPKRSTEEIFANYEQALKKAGFAEIYRCVDRACGPAYAAARWGRFNDTINLGSGARYLAGTLKTPAGAAYVALAVSTREHQITIVEEKAMEKDLVKVSAEALGEDIDKHGHVAVPGIFFDTGTARIKPESAASLGEMAKLLKGRPDLKVWIVGHTDWTGDFALNMRLSQARARAVADALIKTYGIAAPRLDALGVGPASPIATNRTDPGRSSNRRVEMVARP